MAGPSPRRLAARARFAAASLVAAGALTLLLPAVASASSGHGGGGGGLFVALPVGSIFSDILGSVGNFGKDVVKTIFSSVLTLFLGGSWKFLLHPFDIIEWLIGLPGTGNTTAFVPFANNGAGPFAALVKATQGIGLGLLPLALANNALHLVSGGIFTRPRDHMHDFGKVFTAAAAIIAWPWLFGQAIDLANTITLAMLQAANADGNLWKTLAVYFTTAWAGGFLDLITTGFLIATILLLVGLIVMKIVLMVALAFMLVAGPIAIAFFPFEFLSRILMLFASVFLALAMIPFGWAVLFALFSAFGASVAGFGNFIHAGLLGGAMKDLFDLICSLICFYLAWKWPFLILGRLSSLVGGNIAAAGEAFSAFGHGGRSAAGAGAAAAGAGAGGADGGAAADGEGGMLAGRLAGLGSFAQSVGAAGGGVFSGLGSTPATYAGYGLGAKGFTALRGASSALRRNRPAGDAAAPKGAQPGALGGDGSQSANPVAAAVAGGAGAGFDAARARGRNFTAGPETATGLGAAGTATSVPGGSASAGAGASTNSAPSIPSSAALARDAAMTAALNASAAGTSTPVASSASGAHGEQSGGSGGGTASAGSAQAALTGTNTPLNNAAPANGAATSASSGAPASPLSPAGGPNPHSADADPRQVLQGTPPPAAAAPLRAGSDPSAAQPSPARLAASGAPSPSKSAAPASASTSSPSAPRTPAAGGSPSGTPARGSSSGRAGGATPTPSSPPARPAARTSTQRPQRKSNQTAPNGESPVAVGDGRPQSPDRPPLPVSPPENS